MTIIGDIHTKLCKWKAEKAYAFQYGYKPKLYIGYESWYMLKQEIGILPMFQIHESSPDTVMGLEVVVVDKKFYLEVK